MFLQKLRAVHFRNFEELQAAFHPGINEIIGENAQGKTSLLEAIFICLCGSSFRTSHLKELIQHQTAGFFVEAHFEKHGITHQVAVSFDGVSRRVFLNHAPCTSSATLLGLMTGVACTPEDVDLIKGAPAFRRRFLDMQIAQVDQLYVHHLNRYTKALKARNILLKQKHEKTLFAWEHELAQSGAYLVHKRRANTHFLCEKAAPFFALFTQKEALLELRYYNPCPEECGDIESLKGYYVKSFTEKRAQELLYGMTLVGPHRDDLEIFSEGRPFRDFASEGQQHLAAISLKLAEWHYLKEHAQDVPLMIIDDFATSLDSIRQRLLFEELHQLGQVFLSSHTSLGKSAIKIKNGSIIM